MNATRRNTDFSTHSKFTPIRKLRRCIVQDDSAVNLAEELIRGGIIIGNDTLGMSRSVLPYVGNRRINIVDDSN